MLERVRCDLKGCAGLRALGTEAAERNTSRITYWGIEITFKSHFTSVLRSCGYSSSSKAPVTKRAQCHWALPASSLK